MNIYVVCVDEPGSWPDSAWETPEDAAARATELAYAYTVWRRAHRHGEEVSVSVNTVELNTPNGFIEADVKQFFGHRNAP